MSLEIRHAGMLLCQLRADCYGLFERRLSALPVLPRFTHLPGYASASVLLIAMALLNAASAAAQSCRLACRLPTRPQQTDRLFLRYGVSGWSFTNFWFIASASLNALSAPDKF